MVNHTWPPSLVLHGTKDHLLDAETSQARFEGVLFWERLEHRNGTCHLNIEM